MNPVDIKLNDTTIQIEKTIPAETSTVTYDIKFLLDQQKNIQAQKDTDNANRDAELAEVADLIARSKTLGIETAIEITPIGIKK